MSSTSDSGDFDGSSDDGSHGLSNADTTVYEEFSCDDAMIATIRDTSDEDAWIRSSLAVPIEE